MAIKLGIVGSAACAGMLLVGAAAVAMSDEGGGSPVEGRRIFLRENCYSCHGGRAGGGMCPNLRDERPDEGDVREAVREGEESGMPAFPHLTDQDIRNLAAYFQSLRTNAEPTFTHWWEPAPSQ